MVGILEASKQARKDVLDLIKDYEDNVPKKPNTEIHERWLKKDVIKSKTFRDNVNKFIFTEKMGDKKILDRWGYLADIYRIYRNEVMLCSEPIAFRDAFRRYNHRGDTVDINELVNMRRSGLNFIPVDPSIVTPTQKRNSYFELTGDDLEKAKENIKTFTSIYQHKSIDTREQGMVLGKDQYFVRTCKALGEYSDQVTDEYVTYDPMASASALIRARYLEKLSENLFNKNETGLIMQLMKKLIIRNEDIKGEEYKVLYVMSFCEIIPFNRWPDTLKSELLESYNHEINLPYLLRPMDPGDVKNHLLSLIRLNVQLGDEKFNLEQRSTLGAELVNKWSYPLNKKCRDEIAKYITNNEIRCSHSTGNTRVHCETLLPPSDFHIGHIFSQYWCQAYLVFQESMNHPDNLYLSCPDCNLKLKEGCPDRYMLRSINSKRLTIGDLLRQGKVGNS